MLEERPKPEGGAIKGVLLAFGLHAIQLPLGLLTTGISALFIGLSQLVYIIPAILIARQKGRRELVKGLIIGASITFLLNTACFGFFFLNPPDFR